MFDFTSSAITDVMLGPGKDAIILTFEDGMKFLHCAGDPCGEWASVAAGVDFPVATWTHVAVVATALSAPPSHVGSKVAPPADGSGKYEGSEGGDAWDA